MAYTNYNASQTLARANTYSRYTTGMCLNYCWRCTDYPTSAGLPDAKAAWYAAKYKVTNGSTPPPGAHVYWAVGTHWHIAISRGGWYVRSTDWPSKGYVGNVLISRLSSAWVRATSGGLATTTAASSAVCRSLPHTRQRWRSTSRLASLRATSGRASATAMSLGLRRPCGTTSAVHTEQGSSARRRMWAMGSTAR